MVIANQYGPEGIRYFAKLVDRKYGDHFPNSHHCMNTCCEGQGTRIFGSLPEYIYSTAKDGIYVNLYTSAEINCSIRDQPVQIAMHSKFPYDPGVRLSINSDRPARYKIRVRIPSWASDKMPVMVNGIEVGKGNPGVTSP